MNPQPYRNPPRWWRSQLSPRFVRFYTPLRNRELRQQGITSVSTTGGEVVAGAIQGGCGVLLVSNHSYHYDSYAMIEAGRRNDWHPHIMTAWQVFMQYTRIGQSVLQRHGCFSINREANDTQAIRLAVSALESGSHPLLIYPEGDIYHSNDRVMPFRDGAAAIALMAQKKKRRPVVVIPCAMKCFYTQDPTRALHQTMDRIEQRINWRPSKERPLIDRIYHFGNGFLALKEVEYLGEARTGALRERILFLANSILTCIREKYQLIARGDDLGERIRHVRMHLIQLIEKHQPPEKSRRIPVATGGPLAMLQQDMDDLFFVTQLSSYHGDYSSERPTIERMAETIDKFEEDVFTLQAPTPRGERQAVVRFGEPMELCHWTSSAAKLTRILETSVQSLLNEMQPPRGTVTGGQ